MNTDQERDLLAYQRAEHETAKSLFRAAAIAEYLIVTLAVAVPFVGDPRGSVGLAAVGLNLAVGWRLLFQLGSRSRFVAERARRAVVLEQALGVRLSGKAYSDLVAAFTASKRKADLFVDVAYYGSSLPLGPARLCAMLEESVFWSKHLMRAAANRAWVSSGFVLVLSIGSLVVVVVGQDETAGLLGANVVCSVLAFLVSGSMFSEALGFEVASRRLDDIEGRMPQSADKIDDVLPVFEDYNAAVQEAPVIPSSTYSRQRERLNALWQERAAR